MHDRFENARVGCRRALAVLLAVGPMAACRAPESPSATASRSNSLPVSTDVVAAEPTTSMPAPTSTAPTSTAVPGELSRSTSAGDSRFPELGSDDLDVEHYSVSIDYDPDERAIEGRIEVEGVLLARTDQLAFDAVGLGVESVAVDGVVAEFELDGTKLLIALSDPRPSGTAFAVEVDYATTVDDRSFGPRPPACSRPRMVSGR